MTSRFLSFVSILSIGLLNTASAQEAVKLEPGMVIETSITVLPDHYHFPADSSVAIIIRGDSITVDCWRRP